MFHEREHVTQHNNSVWSDVMIEATYMKFGKGPGSGRWGGGGDNWGYHATLNLKNLDKESPYPK